MTKKLLLPFIVLILSAIALVGYWQGAKASAPAIPPTELTAIATNRVNTPCIPNDPFQLSDLRSALSDPTPPTTPVEVNRFITVEYVGKGNLVDANAADSNELPPTTPSNPTPNEPPATSVNLEDLQFSVFNTETKNEFLLTLGGDMLTDIRDCYDDNGLDAGTMGSVEMPDIDMLRQLFLPALTGGTNPSNTRSVSNDIDTRAVRQPTTTRPWRSIANFTNNCTGTMVGPRHVITVAHCINRAGTNTWYSFSVIPGNDSAAPTPMPYGSSAISVSPAPGQTAWYFTHPGWRSATTTDYGQWDWGFIVIPDRLGDQSEWMGYGALPGSQLEQYSQYNRGYPWCSAPLRADAPASCEENRLYGDLLPCEIGGYEVEGPDGWNRKIIHSCDTTAGNSGSAMYQYFFDTTVQRWVPMVIGVHYGSRCDRDLDGDGTLETSELCTASDDFPSVIRRNTPTEVAIISYFREVFP